MSWTPPPGAIGLTHFTGLVSLRASLGQHLLREPLYNHAFVTIGNGAAVESQPAGAKLVDLDQYEGEYIAYGFLPNLNRDQANHIVRSAMVLRGIGYRLSDYAALAAYRHNPSRLWAARHVHRAKRLLPAQFVAETYRRAGIALVRERSTYDITLDQLGDLFLRSVDWKFRAPLRLSPRR